MSKSSEPSAEKLVQDLKTVVRDAEDLMKVMASDVSAATQAAKEKLTSTLESAKSTCHDLEAKCAKSAKAADEYVHNNPYQTIGIAFGVGLMLGALMGRK